MNNNRKKDGGPAFPLTPEMMSIGQCSDDVQGMSLRDWFAGQALSGITSDPEWQPAQYGKAVAKFCYELADAMLEEKQNENS